MDIGRTGHRPCTELDPGITALTIGSSQTPNGRNHVLHALEQASSEAKLVPRAHHPSHITQVVVRCVIERNDETAVRSSELLRVIPF